MITNKVQWMIKKQRNANMGTHRGGLRDVKRGRDCVSPWESSSSAKLHYRNWLWSLNYEALSDLKKFKCFLCIILKARSIR